VLRGLTVSKGSVYTGSDILIMILRCETACPLQLGERHERSVMNRSVNPTPAWVADRRWGCRGSEMAINMQRRKTPWC
jgi:hypothetical protein